MLKKNIFAGALVLSLSALSANASAQTYLGATVGQAKWNVDCSGTTSCKSTDTAFKLLGGYDLTPNVSLEASYFSLGKTTASIGGINGEIKGSGIDFSGVVKTDASSGFSGFAKLGVAYVKGEEIDSAAGRSSSTSKNSAQPVAGLGLLYEVSSNVHLRFELESRKVKIDDSGSGSGNVRNFSIGAQVRF